MRPPYLIMCALSLAGCAVNAWKPPQISYDELEPAVLEADPPKPVEVVEVPKLLPLPGQLKPLPAKTAAPEAKDPKERVAKANDAARVQPTLARAASLALAVPGCPCRGSTVRNWPVPGS